MNTWQPTNKKATLSLPFCSEKLLLHTIEKPSGFSHKLIVLFIRCAL